MAYDVLNSDPIRNRNKKFPKLLYFSFYNTFVFSVNEVRFKNNLRWTQWNIRKIEFILVDLFWKMEKRNMHSPFSETKKKLRDKRTKSKNYVSV